MAVTKPLVMPLVLSRNEVMPLDTLRRSIPATIRAPVATAGFDESEVLPVDLNARYAPNRFQIAAYCGRAHSALDFFSSLVIAISLIDWRPGILWPVLNSIT